MFGISLKGKEEEGLAALYVVESLVVGDEVGQVDGLAGGGDGTSGCGGVESHCARDSLSGTRTRRLPRKRDSLLVRVRGRAERESERVTMTLLFHLSLRQPASGADQSGFESRENKRSATMFSRYDSRACPNQ